MSTSPQLQEDDMINHHHSVKIHSEISQDLDYDHNNLALNTLLRDCTDEQLISEIARRNLDLQHKVTSELVTKYYQFEKLLGHGASGKVYLVTKRDTGEKFACKVIKKDGSMNDAQSMTTEIEIMKRMRHKHVVSMYELFESSICMWLILELVEGGGLRGFLASAQHYSEAIASRFLRQILSGLHYLHNHGVIHRDLKLDNILLNGDIETGDAKIADFGLSALVKMGSKGYHNEDSAKRKRFGGLSDMWGTPTHYSPELISRAYGPQTDVWSLGCMMYEMLTGHEAFPVHEDEEREALYRRIKAADYNKTRLEHLSPGAIDLIARILEPDPVRRYSASEALRHPWITGEGHVEEFRGHLGFARDSFRLSGHFQHRSGSHVEADRPPSGRHGLGIFSYLFGSGGGAAGGNSHSSHHGGAKITDESIIKEFS